MSRGRVTSGLIMGVIHLCIVVVQLVVSDSATPRTAALQASLSFTISQSLLRLMSIELVMPSNHLIVCRSLLLQPDSRQGDRKHWTSVCWMNRWLWRGYAVIWLRGAPSGILQLFAGLRASEESSQLLVQSHWNWNKKTKGDGRQDDWKIIRAF